MKLQTMLLPTGEFALIASNCPSTDTDDAIREFRRLIGAAGVLITDEDVEVENALVDDKAYRSLPFDENDQRIVSTLEAGGTYTPAGLVDTKENPELRTTADLEPELAKALAKPKLAVGDSVKIVGPSVYHADEDHLVQVLVGVVEQVNEKGQPLVKFRHPDGELRRWYFEPGSLEVMG